MAQDATPVEHDVEVGDTVYRARCERTKEGILELQFDEFSVERLTPKGYWVRQWVTRWDAFTGSPVGMYQSKFVHVTATKQFTDVTKAKALSSLQHRKRAQLAIVTQQLDEWRGRVERLQVECQWLDAVVNDPKNPASE